jgi:tRNA dimethylallyltransferase
LAIAPAEAGGSVLSAMPSAERHQSPGDTSIAPLLLAGPTAVGKSEVALCLAERLRGEIVSVDSMQVYRGLDVGTAKPAAAEQARVRHHLIDIVALDEPFDAARFVARATEAAEDIQARGKVPILCGGTGLYFKAFLEGLGEAPPADPALRAELEAAPLGDLLRELAERDPTLFARIDRQNARRVVRALEVIRLTDRPFSAQRAAWVEGASPAARPMPRFFALSRRGEDLRLRIEARVEAMFALGLVAETGQLLRHGLAENRTAMQAIGYRQVVEHLRGERSLAETIVLVKQRTRQFAKRQMTWFRRQLPVRWLEVGADDSADAIANKLESALAPESSSSTSCSS